MSGQVRLDVTDGIARIVIDRPEKRNAWTTQMWTQFLAYVRTLEERSDVAAVVLQGAGGSFSAGADLNEVRNPDAASVERYRALGEKAVRALIDAPMPTIALIEGACFGAGCSLALACDVRICSPRSCFGIPALLHGLTYEPMFLRRLVQVVGQGAAGLLIYGGERWDAAEAASRGLVDRCTVDPVEAVDNLLQVLRGVPTADLRQTATALRGSSVERPGPTSDG